MTAEALMNKIYRAYHILKKEEADIQNTTNIYDWYNRGCITDDQRAILIRYNDYLYTKH